MTIEIDKITIETLSINNMPNIVWPDTSTLAESCSKAKHNTTHIQNNMESKSIENTMLHDAYRVTLKKSF